MAEYANMITVCSITTTLFLGGWLPLFPVPISNYVPPLILMVAGAICLYHGLNPRRPLDRFTLPFFALVFFVLGVLFCIPAVQPYLTPLFWFAAKTGFLLFVFIWVRATLPRFRYDQLMGFAWKFLFPVALINLLITGLMVSLSD
jgi:NADH-quinone oxidoreductase subunit H